MSAPTATVPLAGLRVLVTRSREQAGELTALLSAAGATPLELPAIEIRPAPTGPLDAALLNLDAYDWLILTSVNGVRALFERVDALGLQREVFERVSVAAIGRATAQALEAGGLRVAFVPVRFIAEAVVEGLVALGIDGKRVLLARADIARDTLPDGLRAAGATVDVVVAYQTRPPEGVPDGVVKALHAGEIDAVTFGSPSAVRNTLALVGGEIPRGVTVACIGPITADAATRSGLRVDIVAEEYSMPGLVDALVRFVGARSGGGMSTDDRLRR